MNGESSAEILEGCCSQERVNEKLARGGVGPGTFYLLIYLLLT